MAVEKKIVRVSAKNGLVAQINWPSVKEGSTFKTGHMPEGEYVATIKAVNARKSKENKTPMWEFVISPDDRPSNKYPYYIMLTDDGSWKVRKLLEAVGAAIPKSAKTLNAQQLVGKKVGIVLVDDEYNDRVKSSIDDLIPVKDVVSSDLPDADEDPEEDEDDEFEEEEEAPRKKRPAKKAAAAKKKRRPAKEEEEDDDEFEDEEDDEEEDDDEIDLDDL